MEPKFCLDRISEHYFSWQTWANFSDEGEKPALNKYHFKELAEESETPIEGTDMFVTAFRLSHAEPYQSTAFLIRKDSSYVLYFGDTGADTIEHAQHLYNVWQQIAPLIKNKQLQGIFLECSYPNEQPEKQLFGHLTPKFLFDEMNHLASLCGGINSLQNLPLIITHMKPKEITKLKSGKRFQVTIYLNCAYFFLNKESVSFCRNVFIQTFHRVKKPEIIISGSASEEAFHRLTLRAGINKNYAVISLH